MVLSMKQDVQVMYHYDAACCRVFGGTLWLVDGTGSALMRFDGILFCYNKSQRVLTKTQILVEEAHGLEEVRLISICYTCEALRAFEARMQAPSTCADLCLRGGLSRRDADALNEHNSIVDQASDYHSLHTDPAVAVLHDYCSTGAASRALFKQFPPR
ncbi:unnamed protein product [Hyaloperonospora brassicae]|uniref:Uncharacterized protein n=1 Tax=Hyaloperonospora brassicae TaxID=162125 RepID=A0AAV0TM39_HYABA|nr:unnamed protein product [Hyaloperonospora brassicae]